ncbi:MAG: uroporphyrinogen decarboxylase family protein [Bacteroidales bacterium]
MSMTHRERVIAALSNELPDRCPMQVCYTPEFNIRLKDYYRSRGHVFTDVADGEIDTSLEFLSDQDMLLAWIGWTDETKVKNTPGDEFHDKWGVLRRVIGYETPFGSGTYNELVGHPLADISNLSSYRMPDPDLPELYTGVDGLLRKHKDEFWIVGVAVTTMYETAWALRGFEQMFLDFALNPEIVDELFSMTMNYHLSIAQNLVHKGVDMIWIGDDVGAQSRMLISPDTWRRFFKEKMATFISTLKAINPEVKIAYHSDGYIIPIIPELIEIGIDILNPIQPGSMNPVEVKKLAGKKLALWGTVDEQYTLPFGKPDDIRKEIGERIRTVGRDGGLILSPTHNIQLDTPIENYLSMIDAIKKPCRSYL